jgi:UDP-N-acetylglucosamine 2-epimerase (non-hydrolysing)
MKLHTVVGTRPEIIRLAKITKVLDAFCEQIIVHTGQNFDEALSDVFFRDLELRPPDHHLGIRTGNFAEQVGAILAGIDDVIARERPDRFLVLGDTNSALSAIAAARRRIPVFHLEAGNRCFDDRVPEELNRRLVDHASTVLMPYTHRSKENLLREGIERQRIFVIGNPILEALEAGMDRIHESPVLAELGLSPGEYFLVTLHRAENVDDPARLGLLRDAIHRLASIHRCPVIVSLHPRTADRLDAGGIALADDYVRVLTPLGLWDFVALEQSARCVVTDSGTVQEECAIFHVPNVTIRDVTERAETIEVGSNILAGADPDDVASAVEIAVRLSADWNAPAEYLERHVSSNVAKIVTGYVPVTN